MTIGNTFEFINARELRLRFVSVLETGRRNFTGKEYEGWAPTIESKIHEIDRAGEEFLMQLAFGSGATISGLRYVRCVSSATALTPLQPTVLLGGSLPPANLLTGASPDSIEPRLFR